MIIPINDKFRAEVNDYIKCDWNGPYIVTKGTLHNTAYSEGFVSLNDGKLAGFVLYLIKNGQCEILVLQSLKENSGIGSALIKAVANTAKEKKCCKVWLVTTNDNIHAIRFYQRFGFELTAVNINALDEARKLKPAIPLLGNDEIPLKHEFVFNLMI